MWAFLLLLGGWYLVIQITGMPPYILPPPDRVIDAFRTDNPLLLRAAIVTLQEMIFGLLLGVVVGVLTAWAIVWSETVETLVMPWVVTLQNVPKIMIAPLFALWFGFGLGPKLVIVVLLVFFPILVTTVAGLRSVEPEMLDLTRSMGASKWQLFVKARLPAALPHFLSGLKVAASFAMGGAIVGEWIGAEDGLGYVLMASHTDFRTGRLFATLVVVATTSTLLYQLAVLVEKRVLPWHVSVREAEVIAV